MTDNTFLPQPATPQGGTSRSTLVVAGGLVAALALGGGGYFLLSGSSTDVETPTASTVQHRPSKTVARKPATRTAAKAPTTLVPVKTSVAIGRDPFRALYMAPVAAPATSTTTASTTGSTNASSSTSPSTTTQAAAPKVYALKLMRVYGSGKDLTGVFNIGGKSMVAKVGSVFGPTSELKLLSLTQNSKGVWVATIQVGDSDPVDAAKGETLYVR